MRIFHIATPEDWASARQSGTYTTSTLGRSLAEEGFIHAAFEDQWPLVLRRYYAEVYTPLLLLEIDTDRLTSTLVEEQPAPGVEAIYPHIYGPLNVDAVVSTRDISRPVDPAEELSGQ